MQPPQSHSLSSVSLPVTSDTFPTRKSINSRLVQSMTETNITGNADKMRGWLYKWTNYLKGYQKRWFVLNNGILSYYRSQAEMTHTCRGTVYLNNAIIASMDTCHFTIYNGSTRIHLKAASEMEKQRWISALELAKNKAFKISSTIDYDSDDSGNMNETADATVMIKQLNQKLENLDTCFDLIRKHQHSLQKSLSELDSSIKHPNLGETVKHVDERSTIFRITVTALVNACHDYIEVAKKQSTQWEKLYNSERELRMRYEEMVEELAKQHKQFEKSVMRSVKMNNAMPDNEPDDDEEFHDALSEDLVRVTLPTKAKVSPDESETQYSYDSSGCDDSEDESSKNRNSILIKMVHPKVDESSEEKSQTDMSDSKTVVNNTAVKKRRTHIPPKPDYSLNLWGIMKNCVGKDLSRIPVPVNFLEPLSMLQRLTEELEYSNLLDQAARCTDSTKQMAYVAAFTVSVYSTTAERVAKPFNPMLGETYECDRMDDLGWKSLAEQVSHHPPALSNHAEGREWTLWQEFTMSSKFRGQYLSIIPLGFSHLVFKSTGYHYTWKKITTYVQNIIVGKLWIDNVGEMDIINHTTNDKCHLKYYQYSYFSKEPPRKVTGIITDAENIARWVVNGTWNERMEGARVKNPEILTSISKLETDSPIILWKRKHPPAYLKELYNFTELAVQLNEPEDGVAPTDSRLRPDQRLMEQGLWDEANREKYRLEEKQREARRKREAENEQLVAEGKPIKEHSPAWFSKQYDEFTNTDIYVFTHEYWDCKKKQDWSRCPDLF